MAQGNLRTISEALYSVSGGWVSPGGCGWEGMHKTICAPLRKPSTGVLGGGGQPGGVVVEGGRHKTTCASLMKPSTGVSGGWDRPR